MSGIIGIVHRDGKPVNQELLRLMTASLAYRGPDAQQTWGSGSVGFGHAMLRTTWESQQERQPLVRNGLVLVADARIDGRADLVRELNSESSLLNAPDSELILCAYERWGESCLEHLIGDFVFAIWDQRKQQLFCGRDQMGVKPFYYAELRDGLIFGNDLTCIRHCPGVAKQLNEQAVAHFLLFGHNRNISSTIFSAVRRLPPAHALRLSAAGMKVSRYWTLPVDGYIRFRRDEEYVEHFRALLTAAVNDRLRADRISLLMSGGLDSTAIAGLGLRATAERNNSTTFQAHTVVEEILAPDEERHYSKLAAEHLGIPIEYSIFDGYRVFDRFDDRRLETAEPHGNAFAAATFDFYGKAAAFSRLALSGTGGDPLLYANAGILKGLNVWQVCTTFAMLAIEHRRMPRLGIRSTLRKMAGAVPRMPQFPPWCNDEIAARYALRQVWREAHVTDLGHAVRPEAHAAFCSPMWSNVFEHDLGMRGLSLEIRYPFFDVRLVTYSLALPPTPWFIEKHILRCATKGLLPSAVRLRPKTVVRHSQFKARSQQISREIRNFSPSHTLAKFVNWAKLTSDAEKSQEITWLAALRCMCFDRWLRAAKIAD